MVAGVTIISRPVRLSDRAVAGRFERLSFFRMQVICKACSTSGNPKATYATGVAPTSAEPTLFANTAAKNGRLVESTGAPGLPSVRETRRQRSRRSVRQNFQPSRACTTYVFNARRRSPRRTMAELVRNSRFLDLTMNVQMMRSRGQELCVAVPDLAREIVLRCCCSTAWVQISSSPSSHASASAMSRYFTFPALVDRLADASVSPARLRWSLGLPTMEYWA